MMPSNVGTLTLKEPAPHDVVTRPSNLRYYLHSLHEVLTWRQPVASNTFPIPHGLSFATAGNSHQPDAPQRDRWDVYPKEVSSNYAIIFTQ